MHSYMMHVEQLCLCKFLESCQVDVFNITAMMRTCVQMQSEVEQHCVLRIEQLCMYEQEFAPLHMSLCIVGNV